MKKSTTDHVHRKRRKNNLTWLFALLGILVLFLGTILAFLIFSNLSSKPTETVQEVSAVNVEKDIPETDMGDLIYHEPAAENVVMQGGFGYVNNELLVTLDSSDSLSALKDYLRTIGGEVVGEIPVTADYQILLPAAHTQEELEQMIEQLKALPYVRRSSLNYAFELENDAISGSSAYYPNDKKWDDWSGNSGNNWNMKAIDAPGAWVYRNQMQPVNVGVMDGIFYPYHEDLKDVFQEMPLGNVADMGIERYNGGGKWTESDIHGTHVAGIVGAKFDNDKGICGVAPNVMLYGADVHSKSLTKYSSEGEWYQGDSFFLKIALVHLVVDKHCRVINFSQGLSDNFLYSASHGDDYAQGEVKSITVDLSDFLKLLKDTTETEFIICEAAGNGQNKKFFKKDDDDKEDERYLAYSDYLEYMNGDTSKAGVFQRYRGKITEDICESKGINAQYNIFGGITDPEIKDMIIVVGAAQNAGGHSKMECNHTGYEVAAYSNRGSRVDVLAPGGDGESDSSDSWIYSTVPIGDGYMGADGTSMAAPHVAGVAAMILGIDPTFTAKEVKDIIKSTATGSYGEEGYKMLNAKLAVEKAIELRDEKAKEAENASSEPTDGHRYEIFRETLTWEEAKAACEAKGGHLATITSQEEQKTIESLNTQNSKLWIGGYAYFGFSDESSEGNWKWVDGTSTAYTNWHSGEPNNQDGIEHYAMFYEKFQDGTWNDADGIIDAGCAYICEWDDPTDKISQGDSFTDQQLRIIAKDLGVPDDLNVEIKQYPKTYWKAAGLWDIYVEVLLDGKVIASGSFDVETGEMGRNIYIYTPV